MAYYDPLSEKVGGHVPRIPHQIASMVDGKMALKSWMLFSELYKIMVNKVTFVDFKGSDRHNCLFW